MFELERLERQRESMLLRIKLLQEGQMKPQQLEPVQRDMTHETLLQAEQSLKAIERQIERLKKSQRS